MLNKREKEVQKLILFRNLILRKSDECHWFIANIGCLTRFKVLNDFIKNSNREDTLLDLQGYSAGEVDVDAPLKLTKYSGSLPVEHNTITSLLVAPVIEYCCYNNDVELENGG